MRRMRSPPSLPMACAMVRLRLKPASSRLRADLPRGEQHRVAPFADERRGVFVQAGRVAVVGRRFGVFEPLDLGVRDQQHDHASVDCAAR